MRRLRREIEPGAVDAILNLDNPQVGIKGDFPFEPLFRLTGVDKRSRVSASEDSVDARRRVRRLGLRRGSIERCASVQVIDFDENRAGLGRCHDRVAGRERSRCGGGRREG